MPESPSCVVLSWCKTLVLALALAVVLVVIAVAVAVVAAQGIPNCPTQ